MVHQNQISRKIVDFSMRPGPRFRNQGSSSGEEFYCDYLKYWFEEALQQHKILIVTLDGTDGYLTSFIDEAFGRLVYDFGIEKVRENLRVVSDLEPEWITRLNEKTYPLWEDRRKNQQAPRITYN